MSERARNGRQAIRLIDAGEVSHLRSQTMYHGLAMARTEATPDTIVLATPKEPYVCIGFHQDLEREVDTDFCRSAGLPVLRRETGGGAVYLDSDQLFVQWVMSPSSLPARIDRRFAMFAEPLVATYRELGIEARFRPPNDVHVAERKIVGTGAAQIGDAEVVVGNFILDFDIQAMTRILRVPSEAFRDQVARSLQTYMTSMRRELGTVPDRARVLSIYRQRCEEALGVELRAGDPTVDELRAIEQVDNRFRSERFRSRPGGLRRAGVKIHADVHVVEAVHDTADGGVRVTARVREGRLEDVALADAASSRERGLGPLAEALRGVELRPDPVTRALTDYHRSPDVAPDFHLAGWVKAILDLPRNPEETRHERRP